MVLNKKRGAEGAPRGLEEKRRCTTEQLAVVEQRS